MKNCIAIENLSESAIATISRRYWYKFDLIYGYIVCVHCYDKYSKNNRFGLERSTHYERFMEEYQATWNNDDNQFVDISLVSQPTDPVARFTGIPIHFPERFSRYNVNIDNLRRQNARTNQDFSDALSLVVLSMQNVAQHMEE